MEKFSLRPTARLRHINARCAILAAVFAAVRPCARLPRASARASLAAFSLDKMQVVELTAKADIERLREALVARMADPNQNPYADSDWLPEMFPKIQQMPGVRFFAATSNDEYVGLMMAFEVTPRGEFFLNGLRTDPAVRRSGCGTAILRQIDAQLAASGAKSVRMGVASWNDPMRTLSEKKLALAPTRFCGIRCREYDAAAAEVPIRTATAADRDGILALAHADEMVKVTNGLIQSGPGQFCAASAAFFDGMIEKGCVYIADGAAGGAIGAVAILPPSPWADAEKGLSFVAGTDDAAIVSLLTGLRRFGPKPGDQSSAESIPAQIFGYLPFDTPACQLVAEGKVDGWARHSKTFEDVYGWEAGALAAAAK